MMTMMMMMTKTALVLRVPSLWSRRQVSATTGPEQGPS